MAHRLDTITSLPHALLRDLSRFNIELASCDLLEEALEIEPIDRIAVALNSECLECGVVGFHYTRAIASEIVTSGLRPSAGADRRAGFLDVYGDLFTASQLARVQRLWSEYFDDDAAEYRDGRIWFNFTTLALHNGGAQRLLDYFGGEQIYMPLTDDRELAAILRGIGEPLIIEAHLDANSITAFCGIPWGSVWLSTYHHSVNPRACQRDVDAYVRDAIPSSRLRVIAL